MSNNKLAVEQLGILFRPRYLYSGVTTSLCALIRWSNKPFGANNNHNITINREMLGNFDFQPEFY